MSREIIPLVQANRAEPDCGEFEEKEFMRRRIPFQRPWLFPHRHPPRRRC